MNNTACRDVALRRLETSSCYMSIPHAHAILIIYIVLNMGRKCFMKWSASWSNVEQRGCYPFNAELLKTSV